MFSLQFIVLFLVYLTAAEQDQLKVSLYYESLCPFCREFVTEQLAPGYFQIREGLVLDLVPFGNANQSHVNNKLKFHCQHGPQECRGNVIQACALNYEASQDQKMKFVGCVMAESDPSSLESAEKCATQSNLSWPKMKSCVLGKAGRRLLSWYGNRTLELKPELAYVPHILFNDVANRTVELAARDDFVKVACSFLQSKPSGCLN